MRILITGGCGFLGSHLVEHFLKTTNYEVVVLDKLTYASNGYDRLRDVRAGLVQSSSKPLEAAKHWEDRVRVFNTDLSQPLPPGVVQEIGGIDYIIHAAAESHVDRSIKDPLPFLMSNVIGTHHLLMSRTVAYARRVFIVSTDEVYGPASWGEQGFDEEERFRPANPYAASKAGAECLAFAYANTYRLPITIVNTMNLIGERQHPEKFVPLVIRKVLEGETVQIHADPSKTRAGTRFYLHCRTFANALAWLITTDGACPQKLHVCGEVELSNLELATTIADLIGKPLQYELVDFHSSRPGHDLRYAMNDAYIQLLGWRRPMGIMDSLKKTVAWYLANPQWLQLQDTVAGITMNVKCQAKSEWPKDRVIVGDRVRLTRTGLAGSVTGVDPSIGLASVAVDNGQLSNNLIENLQHIESPDDDDADDLLAVADLIAAEGLPGELPAEEEGVLVADGLPWVTAALTDCQVGIFANPLGADIEDSHRRDAQQARDQAILAKIDDRLASLEARARPKPVQGAMVRVTDGWFAGATGKIVAVIHAEEPDAREAYSVALTAVSSLTQAKYMGMAPLTFVAEQFEVLS
jgi:dTDP-glucose 4,6-dehydratase